MKYLFRIAVSLIITFTVLMLGGCTDEMPVGQVQLQVATSGSTNFTSGRIGGRTELLVEITDFQISIRDVELEADGVEYDDDNYNGQDYESETDDDEFEINFEGPFQLDLLNDLDAVTETIGNLEVPNGLYEEIEFDFHKSENLPETHPLFDKSIYVAGTIDGTPFVMWHDTSEELEIEFENGLIIDENRVSVTITFTIEQFLNSLHSIDLSNAIDGNNDGVIEIHPNDPDGNRELAEQLKENIKEAADLLEGED